MYESPRINEFKQCGLGHLLIQINRVSVLDNTVNKHVTTSLYYKKNVLFLNV